MNNGYNNSGYTPGNDPQGSYTPPFSGVDPQSIEAGRSHATASKVLGIVGLVSSAVCCCLPIVGLVLGILALVYSSKATKACGFTPSGATVGKICGIIAIVLCGLSICTDLILTLTGLADELLTTLYPEIYM